MYQSLLCTEVLSQNGDLCIILATYIIYTAQLFEYIHSERRFFFFKRNFFSNKIFLEQNFTQMKQSQL